MKKIAAFATTTILLTVAGTAAASAREAEPRDDHGTSVSTRHAGSATTKAGDDHRHRHGGHGDHHARPQAEPGDAKDSPAVEAGDDKGSTAVEPGDDKGSTTVEAGDD